MALKTMIEQLRQARANINTEARTRIAAELGALLPEGSRLEWDQYTDYFNDGSPCTFSVHEWVLYTKEGKRIDYYHSFDEHENVTSGIEEVWEVFESNQELLQSAFGDHITVTVRSDGTFTTEDCEHE